MKARNVLLFTVHLLHNIDGTVGAVTEPSTVVAPNKYLWPPGSSSGSGCLCMSFSMFLKAPTIQELLLVWDKAVLQKKVIWFFFT